MKIKDINIFIKDLPGEHIYSVLERARFNSGLGVLKDSFYKEQLRFKGKPDFFNSRIVSCFEDPAQAIRDHTDFAYRSISLSSNLYQKQFRNLMSGTGRASIRSRLIANNNRLYYCPVCAKEAKDLYGLPYLKYIHQIEGISVCPEHKCQLIILPDNFKKRNEVLLNSTIVYTDLQEGDPKEIEIAETLEEVKGISKEIADTAYKNLKKGNEKQYCRNIYNDLLEYYGEDFLRKYNLLISEGSFNKGNNWINYTINKEFSYSPLLGHLLLWNCYNLDRKTVLTKGILNFQIHFKFKSNGKIVIIKTKKN